VFAHSTPDESPLAIGDNDLAALLPTLEELLRSRLLGRVRFARGGHWIWNGAVSAAGYGYMRMPTVRGKKGPVVPVHRLAFVLFSGALAPDLQVDHLCRLRRCVAPVHLDAVTQTENLRRAREWRRDHRAAAA
jgi:hypothetical protein